MDKGTREHARHGPWTVLGTKEGGKEGSKRSIKVAIARWCWDVPGAWSILYRNWKVFVRVHDNMALLSTLAFFAIGANAAATTTQTATTTSGCCKLLSLAFGSKVVYPNTTPYDASTSSYFFLQQRTIAPSCILQPKTAQDVSIAVLTLQLCSNVEVAIRSGGHSPNSGFSNANGGVTIDLRGLNGIDVAGDGKSVKVGTGNEWVDVYRKVDAIGKSVVGARVADVGVGGFLSGGKPHFPLPSLTLTFAYEWEC
jgi:hypothetical protein